MSEKEAAVSEDLKTGYCAIVGIPNAGKSTLLNAILGTKLSIISAKPQTTRKRVLGIYSDKTTQIIFLDTPGIMPRPSSLLHHAMLEQVKKSFTDADVLLVLAEANRTTDKALPTAWEDYKRLAGGKPIVLAVSKIDLIKNRDEILPVLAGYGAMDIFTEIVPISARKGKNVKELVSVLRKYLPGNTRFFEEDQLSDQNERFFVSELLRETIFLKYGEEIPYSTEVEIREFVERENGKWYINADIVVERETQKAIIIGKGGEALKSVGERARKEIETFLDHPVFLELHVKARSDWRNDASALKNFGY
jgi:GTPase